jgi:hypothetical protein
MSPNSKMVFSAMRRLCGIRIIPAKSLNFTERLATSRNRFKIGNGFLTVTTGWYSDCPVGRRMHVGLSPFLEQTQSQIPTGFSWILRLKLLQFLYRSRHVGCIKTFHKILKSFHPFLSPCPKQFPYSMKN